MDTTRGIPRQGAVDTAARRGSRTERRPERRLRHPERRLRLGERRPDRAERWPGRAEGRARRAVRRPGRLFRGLLAAVLGIIAVVGLAQAIGIVTLPSRAPWDSEQEAAARSALELDADSIVADGIHSEPVDLLGNPVQEEPGAPGEASGAGAATDGPTGAATGASDDGAADRPSSAPETAPRSQTTQVDAVGRLRIEAVDMDVPLGAMDRGDDVTPPGYRAGYVLRDGSADAGIDRELEGTVVIAMHSMRTGFAPGNYLVGDDGQVLVPDGAEIEALGRTWRVTASQQIPKDQLPTRSDIWDEEPGRLVIITCRQTGAERTTANTVIIAEEVDAMEG